MPLRPAANRRRITGPAAMVPAVMAVAALTMLGSSCRPRPPRLPEAQVRSGKFQAHQAFLRRPVPKSSARGQHDTLTDYAAKCAEATGISVPAFDCTTGTPVPGQGTVPAGTLCDQPNVLNAQCDPGSKFQVLPGGTADAVAVAHCRKVGEAVANNNYQDVAVIQYNKQNGALCFYQALGGVGGGALPAQHPAPSGGGGRWLSPEATEAIGCTGCHDNGGFIRSSYLAQLRTPPHALPSTSAGFGNLNAPVKYVGLDFETNRSWTITAPQASGDTGLACNTCHRLAVPNMRAFNIINGTAANFGNIATAATQASKNPHSASSPIWMRPGQIVYNAPAEASATKYRDCAVGFFNSSFTSVPSGCVITPLGEPWTPPVDGAQFVSQTPPPGGTLPTSTSFSETVTFANSGGIPWVGSHTMSIAASQSGAQIWQPQSVPLGSAQAPINPGDQVPGTFSISTPSQPGTYDLAFVLRGPLGQVFAASPTQQIVVGVPNTPTDNASLTIDSAPGSLRNGATGTVTVTATNTGSTQWSASGYALRLVRGLRLSLPQPSAPLPGTVAIGGSQTLTFAVICNGQGTGWFTAQMAGSQGVFGQRVSRTIVCQP